ncbi:MAG: PspC domain-containing protein [Candidatus Dormiibacterota bacterium]
MDQTPGPQDPGAPGSPPPWGSVPPTGGPLPPPRARRLYRLRNDRVVAGVASGLAYHLEVDPVWIRLAFVVLTFLGGLGVVLYLVAWVVMPAVDGPPIGGPTPPPPARRLYRLRDDRVVAGVASGLGAHLDVDPIWVRLAFVVLVFFAGLGVLLYIAAWVAMPEIDGLPPGSAGGPPRVHGRGPDARIIVGAVFLIAAVLVLAGSFNFFDSGLIWGAALIGIGLLFLLGDSWPAGHPAGYAAASPDSVPGPGPGFAAPVSGAGGIPPAPSAAAPGQELFAFGSSSSPAQPGATPAASTAYSPPAHSSYTAPAYSSYTPFTPYAPRSYPPADAGPAFGAAAAWSGPTSPSGRVPLGTIGFGGVVLALGVALLLQSVGLIHLTVAIGFGIVFAVLGLTLVVGARFGRSGGLVALGICLLPFAAAALLVPEPLTGGVGNLSYTPPTVSALQPAYHLTAGQLTVDLSGVDLGGGSASVTTSVAFGHLVVVVPAGTNVDLTSKVGAGEVDLLGRVDSGVQLSNHFDTSTGLGPTGTLDLNVAVGCGQLTVMTGSTDVQTGSTPPSGAAPVAASAQRVGDRGGR